MSVRISPPSCESGSSCSARRRSPVERWQKSYFSTRRSRCVPFPKGKVLSLALSSRGRERTQEGKRETHQLLGHQARTPRSPFLSRIWVFRSRRSTWVPIVFLIRLVNWPGKRVRVYYDYHLHGCMCANLGFYTKSSTVQPASLSAQSVACPSYQTHHKCSQLITDDCRLV